MMFSKTRLSAGLRTSPWIILAAAVILLVVVVVLAQLNIQRDRRHMTELLSTRAIALIRAVEAGARTGMMGTVGGGAPVQRLIEEVALLPEVLYIAVLELDGTVVAHSDPERIGEPLHPHLAPLRLEADFEEKRQPLVLDDGREVFEVMRQFRPLTPAWRPRGDGEEGLHRRRGMRSESGPWPRGQQERQRLICVGLDMQPLAQMVSDAVRHTILMSAVLLLLGFAGFVSLFWMNSYRIARRSLQDTSAFADEVVTHLPVGLIATDRQGRIAFFNAAAAMITGVAQPQALGQDPAGVLPGALGRLMKGLAAHQGQLIEQEMECELGSGKTIPLSVSATRIVNEEGVFVGNVLIVKDLGELRRLQAEVRRQEKLVALGGMAAGVAHEIRNPLSSIKGLATYFAGKFDPGSPDQEAAQVMIQEVDRLNRVIGELLEFARPSDLNVRQSDINALLRHCLQLIQQDAAAKRIELIQALATDLCSALIDPDRLAQCVLNLYLNAIQAMPGGGRLTVASTQVDPRHVGVMIADTGCGIAPEDMDKIFNPYYTTKPKGTGLGLAIVHKIIEAHGGRIQVESSPGQGARFLLTVPCAGKSTGEDRDAGNHSGGR
jgi:two-component system, NtrC family, sensor histidine kinase HydH